MAENNGWESYKIYVTKALEANDKHHEVVIEQLNDIRTDIATLKSDARYQGRMAGGIVSFFVTIFMALLAKVIGF